MKFGYRLVDRYPSPFTNTDTRGTLNFNRNYTNNPVTNTGGSGLATLLTGYMTARRAASCSSRTPAHAGARAVRPGRLQAEPGSPINAGVRYEIFGAETEEDNKHRQLRSGRTCG